MGELSGRCALMYYHCRYSGGTAVLQICFALFFPFGKEIRYSGRAGSLLLNIIWILVFGLLLAIESTVMGCLLCVTVIGIPFGLQHFKIARLALMPFESGGEPILNIHFLNHFHSSKQFFLNYLLM